MLWFDCEFILRVSQREGLPERVDIVSLAVAVERWSIQRPPIMMIDVLSSLLSTSSPARHPNTERVERREGGRESLRRRAPNERRRVATNADARRSSPLLSPLATLLRRVVGVVSCLRVDGKASKFFLIVYFLRAFDRMVMHFYTP